MAVEAETSAAGALVLARAAAWCLVLVGTASAERLRLDPEFDDDFLHVNDTDDRFVGMSFGDFGRKLPSPRRALQTTPSTQRELPQCGECETLTFADHFAEPFCVAIRGCLEDRARAERLTPLVTSLREKIVREWRASRRRREKP